MKLDNFAFSGWQRCPLWYRERIIRNWTVRHKSAALGFGGAIHEGLAEWHRSRNPDAALAKLKEKFPADHPVDDYRDVVKAQRVLLEYMNKYTHESFTVIPGMVEETATLPTGMFLPVCRICGQDNRRPPALTHWDRFTAHCVPCEEPLEEIEYGGIFDTLVEFQGQIYILEHKTTSVMGGRFFDQFKPNTQVTGYVWLVKGMSGRCDGALINAIGIYKTQATRFERQITTRTQHDLDVWLLDLWTEACQIDEHIRTGHFPARTSACTLYGACDFLPVHNISDESMRLRILEQDYVQSEWRYERRDVTD